MDFIVRELPVFVVEEEEAAGVMSYESEDPIPPVDNHRSPHPARITHVMKCSLEMKHINKT